MPVVQPYYGIIPEKQRNFFADYMNGYLGTRTQQMREEYLRWLQGQDPMERLKLQNDLVARQMEFDRYKLSYQQAIKQGEFDLAKELLKSMTDLNIEDSKSKTALAEAGMRATTERFGTVAKLQADREKMAELTPDLTEQVSKIATDHARQLTDIQNDPNLTPEEKQARTERVNQAKQSSVNSLIQAGAKAGGAGTAPTIKRLYQATMEQTMAGSMIGPDGQPVGVGTAADLAKYRANKMFVGVPDQAYESQTAEELYQNNQRVLRAGGGGGGATAGFQGWLTNPDIPEAVFLREQIRQPSGTVGYSVSGGQSGRVPEGTRPPMPPQPTQEGAPTQPVSEAPVAPSEAPVAAAPTDDALIASRLPTAPTAPATMPGETMAAYQWQELQDAAKKKEPPSSWDESLKTFFGNQGDPDMVRKLLELRKNNPAAYDEFMDSYFAANPGKARKAARGSERAQEKADTGLQRTWGEGGPPARGKVTGASYGPEYFNDIDQAAEKFMQDAEYYGWDDAEKERILEDSVGLWREHSAGKKTTYEKREERADAEESMREPFRVEEWFGRSKFKTRNEADTALKAYLDANYPQDLELTKVRNDLAAIDEVIKTKGRYPQYEELKKQYKQREAEILAKSPTIAKRNEITAQFEKSWASTGPKTRTADQDEEQRKADIDAARKQQESERTVFKDIYDKEKTSFAETQKKMKDKLMGAWSVKETPDQGEPEPQSAAPKEEDADTLIASRMEPPAPKTGTLESPPEKERDAAQGEAVKALARSKKPLPEEEEEDTMA